MYFDFDYYFVVLRHVWRMKGHPKRGKLLKRLLINVPLESAFHAVFMLLDYVFFPKLWTQSIDEPVFIVGHQRSGTTLMHRLMSADEQRFSYFLYWEMFFPSLLQKKIVKGIGWLDAKCFNDAINKKLVIWDDKTFGPYRHMHYMSLWAAEEDAFALKPAFVSQQWALDLPIMHVIDQFHVDQMPAKQKGWMRFYRAAIKRQLVLNGGDKIHLAKNPVMSGWVETLINYFPGAKIVVMLRDPAECIPSGMQLVQSTWQGNGWSKEEYAESQKMLLQTCFESFTNPRDVLARYPNTPQIVVDYRELTADPRGTTKKVYDALGLTMTEAHDQALIARGETEKKHSSKFRYSIDDFDVTYAEIEDKLADFYERYDWPRRSQISAGAESEQPLGS